MLPDRDPNIYKREEVLEEDSVETLNSKERSGKIPPEPIENGNLEKAASSEFPSDAGAWWIMLQTAMSIYNYAVLRDPVNNSVLDEFWSELSQSNTSNNLIEYIYNNINNQIFRPLPYDDLMEIIDYCGRQLSNVFANPRHSIIKVDKMVKPYRVKKTGTRTMEWLGKQPGKTIKEKLSGKDKMLTQINEYSFDIKENQVAMMLYKQLMKRVNDRINNGIAVKGYGDDKSVELKKMIKLKKALRDSNIKDAKAINHTVANNVLLGDKNYSIVWKAYLEMCKYDKNIFAKWNKALQIFVKSVFIAVCASISNYEEVQIIEEHINFSDDNKKIYKCIVGYDQEKPLYMTIELLEKELVISFFDINEFGNNKKIQYNLEFYGDSKCNLTEKRGYPVNIVICSRKTKTKLNILADLTGIKSIVDWCLDKVKENYGSILNFKQKINRRYNGTCTYDIISCGDYTTINEEIISSLGKSTAVLYKNSDNDFVVYEGKNNCIYPESKELISISDAVGDKLKTEALMLSLENISKMTDFSQDDYFIYTIPDALEEFSQKNLKQCVKAWFSRSFPVWRSVAALTEILEREKENIQSTNIFLSVDLMGEVASAGLLTIQEEAVVNGFVCNHYPPFPEKDSGEDITENTFLKNYLYKYFSNIGIKVDDGVVAKIVRSGIVSNVLKDRSAHNYTELINNQPRVIRIDFINSIVDYCIDKWLESFKKFWRDIKNLLPKESSIQFINILNDCIMDFVSIEDVRAIVEEENFLGIYCSVNSNINRGAYIYLDRLRNNKPTWTEYLPELSLEVIKNGNYTQLELIGSDVSFDVMGEDNEHIVEEKLILKAGEPEFRFPLKKKDISRTSSLIEAYITDKSFPLEHDVIVKLSVKYKYGYDNSFELTLRPEDSNETAFKEIVVEWANVSKEANCVNIWPPKTNLQPNENVLKEIEDTKSSLIKIEDSIVKHMVNYCGTQDKTIPINNTDKFLNKNIFKIRNIVLSDLPEAKEFIEWFLGMDLYKYLGQIAGIFESIDIPKEFYQNNASEDLSFLSGDCMQVMFSLGKYTPEAIQKYYVSHYKQCNEKSRMKAMVDMLLRNGENKEAINVLMDEIRSTSDEKSYTIKMYALVKELGKMCCFDSDLIYAFYEVDQIFVNDMVRFILQELKKMLSNCDRIGKKYIPSKKDRKRYLGYLESILAILRLRNPERTRGFELLAVGSEEAKRLSNTIRQLDEYMKHPHSNVRFKLTIEKPESLSRMSDLTYALDLYLLGDKRAASIEVVGVEEDEDD